MSEATHIASGKVREIYALDDDRLLLVAWDRISTFDVDPAVPRSPTRGAFSRACPPSGSLARGSLVPNHLLDLGDDGRSTVCRRLRMLPVEFVVRGYLFRLRVGRLPLDRGRCAGTPCPPGSSSRTASRSRS